MTTTPQTIRVTHAMLDAHDGARLVIDGWWYERHGLTWVPDFPPLPEDAPSEELPAYVCGWTCSVSPCWHETHPPPGFRPALRATEHTGETP